MNSKSNVVAIGLAVVAVLIAIVALFWNPAPAPSDLGGTTQGFEDARGGFKINGSFVLKAPATGMATTSATVGCAQITPTSTATVAKLVLSTAGATSTFAGTAYWSYGTCP